MFYDIFSELCEARGISCKRATEEIGLSNSIATKWKKTGAIPQGETLNRIANYFNVSIEYLLGHEKTPTSKDEREIGFNDFTYAMYNESKELTEEDREKLLAMARFLAHEQDKKKNK